MLKSEEKHIQVDVQASYRTLNELTNKTKRVWIVFHGYGQLATYFIKKFEILDPKEDFIIAPQGLSKFYLEGFNGRVGATWMTKEDRLTEIHNQQKYINAILEKELIGVEIGEVILFGFSQGVATMGRFAAYNQFQFDKMVLWAGTFPHDLEKEDLDHWKHDYEISYYTGSYDPFLKEGMIEDQQRRLKELTGKDVVANFFEGKHEVVAELLLQI